MYAAPVGSKNSCGFVCVVFQEPPEPFTTLNRICIFWVWAHCRKEQYIALALMIPFGEDAPPTVRVRTKPLADAQLEAHAIGCPGQIGERALIVTVETLRRCGAQRTPSRGLGRAHVQGDLCRSLIDRTRLEAQRGRIG